MAEEELPIPAPLFSVTAKVDKEKIPLPDAHDPVTGTGRWLYEGRLGEGGLATVFRAWDCKGNLGFVAVKVLKRHSKAHARHAFAMHRESQWSLLRLHNPENPRYSQQHASLFARYLEDHTGFADLGPEDFEERRKYFESPEFNWYKKSVTLPNKPYVVMELVKGETLQNAMPTMTASEKREVILQCATALEYLESFGLIHRDFRGCNMHLIARENGNDQCQLKILDLGVMISAEAGMEQNCNMAVQAFRRRGDTDEKRKRYDWLPWEVRDACDDLQGPVHNFDPPGHAFDAFSLGVLILHLLLGKTKARLVLDDLRDHPEKMLDASCIGVPQQLLGGLLAEASRRPRPHEVLSQTTALRPSAPEAVPTTVPVPTVLVPSRSPSRAVSHTTTKVEGSDDEDVEVMIVETKIGPKEAAKEAAAKEAAAKEAAAKEAAAKEAAAKEAAAKEAAAKEAAAKEAAAKEAAAKEAAAKEAAAKEAAAKEAAAKEAGAREAAAKAVEALYEKPSDKRQTERPTGHVKSRSRSRSRRKTTMHRKSPSRRRRRRRSWSRRRKSRSRSRSRRKKGSPKRRPRVRKAEAKLSPPKAERAPTEAKEEAKADLKPSDLKATTEELQEESQRPNDEKATKEARLSLEKEVQQVQQPSPSVWQILRQKQTAQQEEEAEHQRQQREHEEKAKQEMQKAQYQQLVQQQLQQQLAQQQLAQQAELNLRSLLGPVSFPLGFGMAVPGMQVPMPTAPAMPQTRAGIPGVRQKASAPPPPVAPSLDARPVEQAAKMGVKGPANGQSLNARELMAAAASQLVKAKKNTSGLGTQL